MLSRFSSSRLISRLTSLELTLVLFGTLCLVVLSGTLFAEPRQLYGHPLFLGLLAFFWAHLTLCTIRRWRTLAKSTIAVHCGVLVTLLGAMVSSFGYVATVNIYEGSSTDQVYRWDLEKDMPLGVSLAIKKIHREYYPIPLKIGVLRGADKLALSIVNTGQSFPLADLSVRIDQFDKYQKKATLTVFRQGTVIGHTDTEGLGNLPQGFPYRFKLVAFQDPKLKRIAVDMELLRDGHSIAAGSSEVNHPFTWEGLSFFCTRLDRDKQGLPYAGMQIVRDPGTPWVFTGMFILCLGAFGALYRRFHDAR